MQSAENQKKQVRKFLALTLLGTVLGTVAAVWLGPKLKGCCQGNAPWDI